MTTSNDCVALRFFAGVLPPCPVCRNGRELQGNFPIKSMKPELHQVLPTSGEQLYETAAKD